MFDDQTCQILGAGASRPYGFPTSGELRQLLLGGHGAVDALKALKFPNPDNEMGDLEADLLKCAHENKRFFGRVPRNLP